MLKSGRQLVLATVRHQACLVHLVKLSELCDLRRHETFQVLLDIHHHNQLVLLRYITYSSYKFAILIFNTFYCYMTFPLILGTVIPQKEGPPAAVAAARCSSLAARRRRIRVQKDKSLHKGGGSKQYRAVPEVNVVGHSQTIEF